MGVPKFFRWISERYPCLSEVIKEYQIPEFDNLYLDMNGIIHMCSHPNDFDPHFRITEEKIIKDIFHYIEILFRMIQPQKLFFMAIDGVAPRAKMNQQRGRRFRSAKEAEILEQKARERGEALPTVERFDSNCITPGTKFMATLHEQLKFFVTWKVSSDPLWQKCKVILSGHETPGEGEHKIMDYIRFMKSRPNYDPNTRHCLYGLDADLIMLGLCSHEPHFSLLREEVKFGKKQKRTSTPEETTFFLLHLSLMRDYLELEFADVKDKLSFQFDIEHIIDDWVLMGFLVGNDFIPPLPEMHIANGALPMLYKAYMDVLPSLGGYINEGGTLNLLRFQTYMEKLSVFDFEHFRDTYADLKYFEGKTGRQPGGKERHSYKNKSESSDKDLLENEDIAKPITNPDLAALIKSTDDLMSCMSSDDDDVDAMFDLDDDSDEATFLMEFSQHKKDYYMNKLEYDTVNSEVLQSQAEVYVRAIQWNLNYYYNGVCSWSWFYPHHYAPYISDIRNFSEFKLDFDIGEPFLPFQQLLAVLPAASKKLLPAPYQELMINSSSPIIYYYPSEFKTDLNGKKQEWEAVVLIPFIEEKMLLDAMEPCLKHLTTEERKRNSPGPMLQYSYTEEDHGPYEAPDYFLPLSKNHAQCIPIYREDIYVERSALVKGLCPGVRLDVYFPGFPTLKHIPHTASLQKAKVKVFEQASRGENLILHIAKLTKPDIKDVAAQMLGKEIFVMWPHLVEARVIAVSNKDFRYNLVDDSQTTCGGKDAQFVVSEVKGNLAQQWILQRKGLREHNLNRLGIDIGEITVLVYALPILGHKYLFGTSGKIKYEKQWCDFPATYAYQTTLMDIAVHDLTCLHFKTLQDIFPPKAFCFMLGYPHYGAMGEVVDGGTTLRSGFVKVRMPASYEPDLDNVHKHFQDFKKPYMHGNTAAQKLGISSHLISRITGTIYIVSGSDKGANLESCNKVNVGLNLKFSKRNEEIPGYTRKEGTLWLYSNKAVELVKDYMKTFPELFDYLAQNTGNDIFYEGDVLPNGSGSVTAIATWLKDQPFSKIDRQSCGSDVLEPEAIQEIEKAVDNFYKTNTRTSYVVMQVKPHLLYKPELQVGSIVPDPSATHRLYDRIVNVRASYTVPLGHKGTIIGIHKAEKETETMYEVVFDKPFVGGLTLNCSEGRGYRLPQPAILNISHGQRHEQVKAVTKPSSALQNSGAGVTQDGNSYTYNSHWSSQPRIMQNPNNMTRPASAFASWNNHQPNVMPNNHMFNPKNPFSSASTMIFQKALGMTHPVVEQRSTVAQQIMYPKSGKGSNVEGVASPGGCPMPSVQNPVDAGAELLKKMLCIANKQSQAVPKLGDMKKLSVQDIFQHAARASEINPDMSNNPSPHFHGLHQDKGDGRVQYMHPNAESRDSRTSSGDSLGEGSTQAVLNQMFYEQRTKPGTNNLPTPPQQWCQGRQYHTPGYQPQSQVAGGDIERRDNVGTPPWSLASVRMQGGWSHPFSFQQPWAHLHSNKQQQQPEGGKSPSSSVQGSQFVPLQAVKQHRSKATPPNRLQFQRKAPSNANGGFIDTALIVTSTAGPSTNPKENTVTNQLDTCVTPKPVIVKPRKSRIAARFGSNVEGN